MTSKRSEAGSRLECQKPQRASMSVTSRHTKRDKNIIFLNVSSFSEHLKTMTRKIAGASFQRAKMIECFLQMFFFFFLLPSSFPIWDCKVCVWVSLSVGPDVGRLSNKQTTRPNVSFISQTRASPGAQKTSAQVGM